MSKIKDLSQYRYKLESKKRDEEEKKVNKYIDAATTVMDDVLKRYIDAEKRKMGNYNELDVYVYEYEGDVVYYTADYKEGDVRVKLKLSPIGMGELRAEYSIYIDFENKKDLEEAYQKTKDNFDWHSRQFKKDVSRLDFRDVKEISTRFTSTDKVTSIKSPNHTLIITYDIIMEGETVNRVLLNKALKLYEKRIRPYLRQYGLKE